MVDAVATVLAIIAVIGSGLVAGVFYAVAASVLPALMKLPAGRYVEMHRELGKGYHPMMPLIVNGAMFADIGLIFLAPGQAARLLFLAAAVLLVGVQGVSHLANVPINRRLVAVDPNAIPAGWRDPRPQWRGWHRLRTTLALLAVTVNATASAVSV
ncbi:anthrone oxygenase family protein [Amycolatopsis aidingensis]|uniref:anthrone oxygenase family protein n=1 Tax=Amycolatopsis aidingensis TaxID=2842453 RepID=UPI001C0ADFFC|nr:anthrone oxygenase family protein [Amycolatopsis aidingensis]